MAEIRKAKTYEFDTPTVNIGYVEYPAPDIKIYAPGDEPEIPFVGLRVRHIIGGMVVTAPGTESGKVKILGELLTPCTPVDPGTEISFLHMVKIARERMAAKAMEEQGKEPDMDEIAGVSNMRMTVRTFAPLQKRCLKDTDHVFVNNASYDFASTIQKSSNLLITACGLEYIKEDDEVIKVLYYYTPSEDAAMIIGMTCDKEDTSDAGLETGLPNTNNPLCPIYGIEYGNESEINAAVSKMRVLRKEYIEDLRTRASGIMDKPRESLESSTAKQAIAKAIARWMNNTTFPQFCNAIEKRVIGQDELSTVLMSVWMYLESIANEEDLSRNHTLIAAPSGTGKTETYRALREYFKTAIPELPVIIVDSTKLTTEGFKGLDTAELFAEFIGMNTDGVGLVFLDEFDKRIMPQNADGKGNVGEETQNQLLTVIEGTTLTHPKVKFKMNSANTLFIAIGSFDHLRKIKAEENKQKHKTMGFGSSVEEEYSHYDDITEKDIILQGGTHELVGRFPILVNYHKLSEEAITNVINKFKTSLESQFKCDISLDSGYTGQLVDLASGELGLRNVYNKMLRAMIPTYKSLLCTDERDRGVVFTVDGVVPGEKGEASLDHPGHEEIAIAHDEDECCL